MKTTVTIQGVHNWLQFATVAFGLLVAISELAGWRGSITLAFGLVSAVTGLAGYFTGKRSEASLESKINRLETEQAGRTLSASQIQTLIAHLRTIQKPSQDIHLMGLQGNRESIHLANVLKQCFEDAGFAVDGVWEDFIFGGTGPGILIRQESMEGLAGQAISGALQKAGLETRVVELGNLTKNKVEIFVAYKP